ncbi:hypothetical protein KN400_3434 [Geobacter sulfurreducens KN400]|nr:hypothetical protein KN400_3434 [Geobacter sulfurreducens KN400]
MTSILYRKHVSYIGKPINNGLYQKLKDLIKRPMKQELTCVAWVPPTGYIRTEQP